MNRIVSLVACAAIFLCSVAGAFAGQQPSPGSHTATATNGSGGGSFSVAAGGSTVTWTDGNTYTWVPTEPAGTGYYRFNGPPERTLTFLNGHWEWGSNLGAGSYSPL